MNNYSLILEGLKEFYDVNEDLRKDLEEHSIEETGRSLEANFKLFAQHNANSEHTKELIEWLDEMNSEPHCISEMEDMYELIDEFKYMEEN